MHALFHRCCRRRATQSLEQVQILEAGGFRRDAERRAEDAKQQLIRKTRDTGREEQVFYRHLDMREGRGGKRPPACGAAGSGADAEFACWSLHVPAPAGPLPAPDHISGGAAPLCVHVCTCCVQVCQEP